MSIAIYPRFGTNNLVFSQDFKPFVLEVSIKKRPLFGTPINAI